MAKTRIVPFCGYPIYKISTGKTLNKKELSFLQNLDKESRHKDNGVNLHLTNDVDILNNIELKRIKSVVWDSFKDYVDNVLEIENNFSIVNSWGTTQKKGQFHPRHNHPNAIFSSVFYVQTKDSSLIFSLDRSKLMEGFLIDYNIKNYNFFNSLSWEIPVKRGDIVFFPGELQHYTPTHNDDKERLVIGVSYFLSGKFGMDSNYNSISV